MIYHQAKDPDSYQRIFYQQIGLTHRNAPSPQNDWSNETIGSIYTYGTMDTIQFGIGDYTIPQDFLAEFQYDTEYLHAGIIYEGITYSLVENRMQQSATPSPFLAIEHACGGINCWRRGQHFKGVEISIEMEYLKKTIFPYLGISEDSLDFLVKNVRHVHLPKELTDLILQIQHLLEARTMTPELLLALGTTFTAFLIRPDLKQFFFTGADVMSERIFVGKRQIHIRPDDYKKIVAAHDLLRDEADSFVTIYALSQTLGIGEQKLKAGFQQLYQQTIWDYANQVRMTKAASLLKNTDKTVDEIARLTGYQSPAAFRTMFKKWSQTTPRKFRSYFSGTE